MNSQFTIINIGSSLEKSWYVVFQYRESCIYVLQNTNYCVMLFHCQFSSFQSTNGIKRTFEKEVCYDIP